MIPPIRDLCRREGIRPSTYYAWLKDFMEVGKERLTRDITEDWRIDYNQVRPHSSLGYRPPAPETLLANFPSLELVKLT